MGITAYGVYAGVYYLLPINVVALAAAILLAVVVYFAAVMALGGVEEKDLLHLPKGHMLVQLGKKCYLLRDPEYTAEEAAPKKQKVKKAAGKKRKTK